MSGPIVGPRFTRSVKVRIGVGMGAAPWRGAAAFARLVDDIDELGFDSIWLPEVLTAPTLDPLAGLSFAAAHNRHQIGRASCRGRV